LEFVYCNLKGFATLYLLLLCLKGEEEMSNRADICVVCAWRADCQKKFQVSGRDMKCPDFVRDLSLPKNEEEQTEEKDT